MPKKVIENLSEEELLNLLPHIKNDITQTVYGYLHRPRGQTADIYAYKNHIATSTLYKWLALVKREYEEISEIIGE